jgi:mRNA interferase RelE/StbE
MLKIVISKEVNRTLSRLPRNIALWIADKIGQYAKDPAVLANNVGKLQGRDGYKLRIGDWRVIFALVLDATKTPVEMIVLDIGSRGKIYD